MMRKCALLFKVQLLQQFGINRLLHSGTSREKRQMLLLFIGGVPVSYTHLDVYKRQGHSRI